MAAANGRWQRFVLLLLLLLLLPLRCLSELLV
jgi:hypothetical protein